MCGGHGKRARGTVKAAEYYGRYAERDSHESKIHNVKICENRRKNVEKKEGRDNEG